MPYSATAPIPLTARAAARSRTRHIAGYVYFTFICYVSIGLPLAVLPPFVHLQMGYSAVLAGLAISIQYIATLLSRPWAGRISDHMGAKVSVLWGMACCTASGAFLVGAAALHTIHWLSFRGSDCQPACTRRGRKPGFDRRHAVGHHRRRPGTHGQGHRPERHQHLRRHGAGCAAGRRPRPVLGSGLHRRAHHPDWRGQLRHRLAQRSRSRRTRRASTLCACAGPRGSARHGIGAGRRQLQRSRHLRHAVLPHRHWNGAALCLTAFGLAFVAARVLFHSAPSAALAATQ